MSVVLAVCIGALTGLLSGWGCGGGTLLLLWLVSVADVPQAAAQGINLLYFLPCAAAALYGHRKQRYLANGVLLPAILAGVPAAVGGALLATAMETALLRWLFGVFLLVTGVRELFRR